MRMSSASLRSSQRRVWGNNKYMNMKHLDALEQPLMVG